jgi:hypothetical protein
MSIFVLCFRDAGHFCFLSLDVISDVPKTIKRKALRPNLVQSTISPRLALALALATLLGHVKVIVLGRTVNDLPVIAVSTVLTAIAGIPVVLIVPVTSSS